MALEQFLRQAGYGFIRDRRRGTESFVRRLGSGFYPRLHMYAENQGDEAVFSLHLDQKQTSYAGSHMHNAEYDGAVVEEEIARIKSLITHNAQHVTHNGGKVDKDDVLKKIGHEELPENADKQKKSWWRRIFK